MDILGVKITNFLGIGNAPRILLADRGLVLIQGVNEDDSSATSNGVGKSSIADALCWGIYGETARGISGDAVVNKVAKKNCCVSVYIKDDATMYEIHRYRKDKEFKNTTRVLAENGGAVVDMTKGTEKETQEVINTIMGCSLDVFMAAIYAGQEVTPDLPKMTDKQLKLLIEEAAGVERLEKAYEIASAKLLEATKKAAVAANSLLSAKGALESANRDAFEVKELAIAFDAGRAGRSEAFKKEVEGHKANIMKIMTSLKAIDVAAVEARLAEIGKALSEHYEKSKELGRLRDAVTIAQRLHDRAENEHNRLVGDLTKLKSQYENAETEAKKPCPSCGKAGDDHDVEKYREHVKKRMTEIAASLKAARESLREASDTVDECVGKAKAFQETIPDVSELSREQADLNRKVAAARELKSDALLAKKSLDRQNELAENAMTETNPHAASIEMAQKRIDRATAALDEAQKAANDATDRQAMLSNVAKVFSPSGVRAHILDTVTPYLNDRTADYLSALSDGNISATWSTLAETAKGDLKEKFNIEVENDKGAESFAGLSGGEKRKVRLATMLALQDLVSSRATKPINLWLGDEIDDALDRAGLERLMGILERKARERGTVLVISHSDLRDWIDNVITVTKRGGTSTIEGSLCL